MQKIYQIFLTSSGVSTDSRTVQPGNLFFALSGPTFNGNQFAKDALAKGAHAVVISEDIIDIPADRKFVVQDTLHTLQNLARLHRQESNARIIALTGSNGKTTTKELMHAVLSTSYNCLATQGNLNNHIGVPLTLLSIKKEHQIAVIEMGANHQKEIEQLSDIAQPDAGLITNIGKAHLEGFGGIQGVLMGKTELFTYLKQSGGDILWNADDPMLAGIQHLYQATFSYGVHGKDVCGEVTNSSPTLSFNWQHKGKNFHVRTRLTGVYNLQNALAAVAAGIYFKVPEDMIVKGLESYSPSNSRSQLALIGGIRMILDAYNANPSSMKEALMNLHALDKNGFFIIGDMFELGKDAQAEHQGILDLAGSLQLKGIAVGEHFASCTSASGIQCVSNKEAAKDILAHIPLTGRHVLLKGSRGMKMEELLQLWQG